MNSYSRSFICWFRARQFDHAIFVITDDLLLQECRTLHYQASLDLHVIGNVGLKNSAACYKATLTWFAQDSQ